MKISQYNSMMAIKRHPEFKKNYNAYNKLKNSNKRLQKAFEIKKKWGYDVERIINIEEIKNLRLDCVGQAQCISEKPTIIISLRDGDKVTKREVIGERLYLKVDIYANTDDLMKAFKRIISEYKAVLPKDKGRKREIQWEVYDLKQKGLSFSEIARKKSGIKGNISNDKNLSEHDSKMLKAKFEEVRRAYKKAEDMIKQVGANAKANLKKYPFIHI